VQSPLLVSILGLTPQALLILYAPLGLVGAPTTLRRVIVPGLFLATVVTLTRSVSFLFGWHIPIFLATYLILARLFRFASLLGALAAVSLSFVLVVLADVLLTAPMLGLLGLEYEDVINNPWLYIMFLWMESLFLVVAALLVKWKGFVLLPIAEIRMSPGRRRSSR